MHGTRIAGGNTQDKETLKRINNLLDSAARTPFERIGKPEPLAGNLSGYWSRRIGESNRLVYRATDETIVVIACRFHHYVEGEMFNLASCLFVHLILSGTRKA